MATAANGIEAMQAAVDGMNGAVRDAGTQRRRLNRIALGMMALARIRPALSHDEREALSTAIVDAWERE